MERSLERWLDAAPGSGATGGRLEAIYGGASSTSPRSGSRRRSRAGRPPPRGCLWFMTMFGRDSVWRGPRRCRSHPTWPRGRSVRCVAGQRPRRLSRRGSSTATLGEMTALRGAAAGRCLRLRGRDAALRRPARRVRALDMRLGSSSASSSAEARAALDWIDDYADLLGNGYLSYKRRNEKTGLETVLKDSSGTRSRSGTAPCPASRGRRASSRATPTTPRFEAPGSPGWCGRTLRSPSGSRAGGGGEQAAVRPGLLDRGRGVLRARAGRGQAAVDALSIDNSR